MLSCRVSFAQKVAVIESAPLCSTDRETDSLIDPAVGGPAPADQCLIQFHQPAYTLFPGEDPMDESNDVSTFDFPSIPTSYSTRFSSDYTVGRHSRAG